MMMKKYMIALMGILFFLSLQQQAHAYGIVLEEFTGSDAQVFLEITDDGTSEVTVDASIGEGSLADIRGLFFNFSNTLDPNDLKIEGEDVTNWVFEEGAVDNLGKGLNIKGGDEKLALDLGIEIGTPGAGEDDIQSTSFTMSSITGNALNLEDLFAARLTSVGANRQGSSKLVNTGSFEPFEPGVVPVPEPGTILLLGAGLLGLIGLRRHVTKK